MIKERPTADTSQVTYYRAGSAATSLSLTEGELAQIGRASALHVTGINLALGGGPPEAVLQATAAARGADVLVTFDPNHRPALWNATEAARAFDLVLPHVDDLLCNESEAHLMTGIENLHVAAVKLSQRGPSAVVIKRGRHGALAYVDGTFEDVAAWPLAAPVDSVGAGDAFNAGWIYGRLRGLSLPETLRLASWVAARVVQHPGDYEGFPTLDEYVRWLDTQQLATRF